MEGIAVWAPARLDVHVYGRLTAIHGLGRLAVQLRGVPRKGYGLTLFLSRGKSVASLTLASPRIFCVSRSIPMAKPPCGGQPYLNMER